MSNRDTYNSLSVLILVAAFALLARADEPQAGIVFRESFEDALAAEAEPRPIVLSFGAAWCGWCRKMETDTFTDDALDVLAGDFTWLKIDIDEQKEIAARFGVTSVPQTVVLDAQGRMLGKRGGFLSADRLIAFLEESVKNPHPQDLLVDVLIRLEQPISDDERRDVVTRAVEALAKPDRTQREELLIALKAQGPSIWPVLFDLTADDRLAVRAAAAGALKHATRAELPFHPFAAPLERELQRSDWQSWLDNHREAPATSGT